MAARDTQLADAIVAELNAQDWTLGTDAIELGAAREYVTDWNEKTELAGLMVYVIPGEREGELNDRRQENETHTIRLAMGRRLLQKRRAEIDNLAELTEAVIDHLKWIILTTSGSEKFGNISWRDLVRFDADELKREKQDSATVYTGNFLAACEFEFRRLTT
jgi:hypothetical protein